MLCYIRRTELHNFTLLQFIFGAFIRKRVAFIVVLLNLNLKLTLVHFFEVSQHIVWYLVMIY